MHWKAVSITLEPDEALATTRTSNSTPVWLPHIRSSAIFQGMFAEAWLSTPSEGTLSLKPFRRLGFMLASWETAKAANWKNY